MEEEIKSITKESLELSKIIKDDWYQTDSGVVITVLVKNVQQDQIKIRFTEPQVFLNISLSGNEEYNKTYNLSHRIVPEQCSYKSTQSKIEIKLKKLDGGRWEKLEGPSETVQKVISPPQGSSSLEVDRPPTYPTSKKGIDWNLVEREIKKQEEQEKPEGEEALNKLFQDIYGKGSDEVRKAMNKSFMESGGTVLSTNWNEVGKKKVDVKPPDGVEFKKWNS